MLYYGLLYLHIIGACVLLGTGAGIAFFMVMAHRTGNVAVIAGVARIVVIADFLFTATAVVLQPVTGLGLAHVAGYPLTQFWILASLFLYAVTGIFWLPVVRMQMEMRKLADAALASETGLTSRYYLLYRTWFAFGFPAFFAVALIVWLMIAKPLIFPQG